MMEKQENRDTIPLRKFVAPEFVFGAGARRLVGRYAQHFGAQKVLIVTDPGLIATGWTEEVIASLQEEGLAHVLFSGVTPNPRAEEVMAGADLYRQESCDAIVAVGGGSPMDCAKGIGIVSSNHSHILEFEGVDRVPIPAPPLICIPTTAGTAAEVSQFAIITDRQRRIKIAIISKVVVPDVALIDPVTTTTMDAYLTACTGMDALTHACEAFISNAHSPITDLHALEAVRLISVYLPQAIDRLDDLEIRGKMMLGSLHAGLAFSNASLGAVHAMAHSLGGFLDFPHGEANALLLEHVVAFNFEEVAPRYLSLGRAMGFEIPPGKEKEIFIRGIESLRKAVGIDQSLGDLGLKREEIPELARKAIQDACIVTNPRRPTQTDIEKIYEQAL